MPNGNELADVLRWGGEDEYQHEWYAGQELPKEWWKNDFPYREAEKMGYKMSPEETREFYRKKKEAEREKTLSEELAGILKRPEVKMLDPLQRADLIDKIAKAQAVIAKREQEREKHEAEQLEIGRQTQMQQKVQAILQSNRVPAQKLTALTVIGVPLSDAQDMVWGKRAPGEEAGRPTREAAPTARARPEELAGALRPEPGGVQFRMVGGELIKEPARAWEERVTPEERIAERTRAEEKYEARRTEEIEAREAERARMAGVYERRREAVKPPTAEERLALEAEVRAGKTAEEARLQAKFAPGELHRKALDVLDEAREAENAGIYERRRGNILEAMEKDLERADAEAAARKLLIAEVDTRGIEITAEKKAEEKERLEREREHWQGVRDNIKGTMADEVAKEDEKAKERLARIDLIDAKGEALKTAKEIKEQERLQKLQEKYEKTRTNIKDVMEKDEERKEAERLAREEKIKEVRELGDALAKKRYDKKIAKIKYDDNKKKIEREYQDSVIAKGEERAKDERDFNVKILDKTMNWLGVFQNLGFDHKDFVEIIPEFLRVLKINKGQEEQIAKALGLVVEKSEEAEKETVRQFEVYLGEQVVAIDKRVKTEGMTPELKNQVEMIAYLYLELEEHKMSKGKGLDKWFSTLKTGGWYFGAAEIPFKTKAAQDAFREIMPELIYEAKKSSLLGASTKLLGKQAGKMAEQIGKPPKAAKEPIEIELPKGLVTACTTFDDSVKNECYETYKALFNTKGVMTEPAMGDRGRAEDFVIGAETADTEDEPRTKKELPVNMNESDYVMAVLQTTTFSRKQKAWLLWKRFGSPIYWEGMRNQAGMLTNLVVEGEEPVVGEGLGARIVGGIRTELGKWTEEGKRIAEWWPFGKEKKAPTGVDFLAIKTEVDALYERTGNMAQVETYLTGKGLTLDEYKKWLRGR